MAENSDNSTLSKVEYLKRYMSGENGKKSKEKKKKKRIVSAAKGMRIVDDDVDWTQLVKAEEKENNEEDDDEAPVVAEIIDERPEEIKRMEEFRKGNKWRILGEEDIQHSPETSIADDQEQRIQRTEQKDSTLENVEDLSPVRKKRHDSPSTSPVRNRGRDLPHVSPVLRKRNDSPDLSPVRSNTHRSTRHDSPSALKKHVRKQNKAVRKDDVHQSRKQHGQKGEASSDLDLSPPRNKRRHSSDSDLSPERRTSCPSDSQSSHLLSGGAVGLVSLHVLRKEKQGQKQENNKALEDESRHAETVFRDKSGKKRDIELERHKNAEEKAVKAEKAKKYAEWQKGVAQQQMQMQMMVDVAREAHKPLARHIDDKDLDKMLREQEREGDPMMAMLRKKKKNDLQRKGVKELPRYKGPPPPPNRFNIMPGYRWDGVDRSNGFEKQRYTRIADEKAVKDLAYKWSVEDM